MPMLAGYIEKPCSKKQNKTKDTNSDPVDLGRVLEFEFMTTCIGHSGPGVTLTHRKVYARQK